MLMCDKCDRTITYVFCCGIHSKLLCSGIYKKICLKEGGVWQKVFPYKMRRTCHACHTRFAIFSPLPSCCVHVNSLMFKPRLILNFRGGGGGVDGHTCN